MRTLELTSINVIALTAQRQYVETHYRQLNHLTRNEETLEWIHTAPRAQQTSTETLDTTSIRICKCA